MRYLASGDNAAERRSGRATWHCGLQVGRENGLVHHSSTTRWTCRLAQCSVIDLLRGTPAMPYSLHIPLWRGLLKIKNYHALRREELEREVAVWRCGRTYFVWRPYKTPAEPTAEA